MSQVLHVFVFSFSDVEGLKEVWERGASGLSHSFIRFLLVYAIQFNY